MARLRVACKSFLLTVFHALSVHLARPSVGRCSRIDRNIVRLVLFVVCWIEKNDARYFLVAKTVNQQGKASKQEGAYPLLGWLASWLAVLFPVRKQTIQTAEGNRANQASARAWTSFISICHVVRAWLVPPSRVVSFRYSKSETSLFFHLYSSPETYYLLGAMRFDPLQRICKTGLTATATAATIQLQLSPQSVRKTSFGRLALIHPMIFVGGSSRE